MDKIRRNVLDQIEKLPNGSSAENILKCKCLLIIEEALTQIESMLENDEERRKPEAANNDNIIQEILEKVMDEVIDFQLFLDVGSTAFSEAIQWFNKSVESYEKDKSSQEIIDRVQIDASRLLSTLKNRVQSNMELCNFLEKEQIEFKKKSKALTCSYHILNSKLSIFDKNDISVSCSELLESMRDVENHAEDLKKFLKDILDEQRLKIENKLDYNQHKIKSKADEKPTVVKPVVQTSQVKNPEVPKQKVETVNQKLVTRDKTVRSEDSKIQKVPDMQAQKTLPTFTLDSCQLRTDRECTGTIQCTVRNMSKLYPDEEHSRVFSVGGIPWKVTLHVKSDKLIRFILFCELEKSNVSSWYCIALADNWILNQLKEKKYRAQRITENFHDENRSAVFQKIPVEIMNPERGYVVNDTMLVAFDLTLLYHSGISRPQSTFSNQDYKQTAGRIHHTIQKFSKYSEGVSQSVTIGNFRWLTCHFFHRELGDMDSYLCFKVMCTPEDENNRDWACSARIEAQIMQINGAYLSKVFANQFDPRTVNHAGWKIIEWNVLMNSDEQYIIDDAVHMNVVITIFEKKL